MSKKVKKSSPEKPIYIRNMPSDLWLQLNQYSKRTGRKLYAVVADAIRQFLERENPQ